MKRWILLLALLTLVAAPVASTQPGVVGNGGFESPDLQGASFVTYSAGSPVMAPWAVEQGSVDHIGSYWQPAEGKQSVDLNGLSSGTLRQDVETEPGEEYVLRFAMAGNPDGPPATKRMDVEWDGQVVASPTFTVTTQTLANMGWTYFEVPVEATSALTTLRFISRTRINEAVDSPYGPAVDDVSLIEDDDGDDCVPPPGGMVAWWPGDGHSMDIVDDHHGTLVPPAVFEPGKVDQAFSFTPPGHVTVPDHPAWAFGTDPFTIDLWVNFRTVQFRSPFVGHDEGGGPTDKWIFWYDAGGHPPAPPGPALRFHINTQASTPLDTVSAPWNPVPGQWHHVAVTRSGDTWSLYIDGSLASTQTSSAAVPDATAPLTIGNAEAFFHHGLIDEVEIFHRALSHAEIFSIWAADSAGKCKPGEDDDEGDDDDFDDDGDRDDEDGDDDNDGQGDDDDGDDDNDGQGDDDDGDDDNDDIEDEFDSESAHELQFSSTDTIGAGQEKAYDLSAGANSLLLTATAEVVGAADVLDHGLTVEIYNPSGVLIAKAPAALGRVVATAVPALPGTYTVKVRNTGSAAQQYRTLRIVRTAGLS